MGSMVTTNVQKTPLQPLPTNAEELERCLADPKWRIFSGCLYKIKIKGDDFVNEITGEMEAAPTFELPFSPNQAQIKFLDRLWYRNIILKARQLGFTTLICVLWLDHALFNANQHCGIIAQDLDTVGDIFTDKVKFAYDNLPLEIKERFPLEVDNESELKFAHNGSKISVSTSFRGGTLHRLHISEYGKICANSPKKAKEVRTGSLPAVPTNGIAVIESTAEGRVGDFHDKVQISQKNFASRKKLGPKDYRFHFYAWWQEPKYRIDASSVIVTASEHDYFDRVEVTVREKMGIMCHIDPDQRAWYVSTRASDLSGDHALMWQEYPSFPDEAFQVSTEGNYYANDMLDLRKRGGITKIEVLDIPVCTFWDIGNHDGCAIWYHQNINQQDRFIRYYEAHGEDLRHYAAEIQSHGYVYQTHFLPHDAAHQRLGDYNKSVLDQLQELLPGHNFIVIPRITQLTAGILMTRKYLKNAWFDEARCQLGIQRLEGYKKKFSQQDNRYIDQPDKSNGCSEGADALRQWSQAKDSGLMGDYVYTASNTGLNSSTTQTNTHGYVEAPATDWRF
ncbi:terminase [Acinetobacter ursingii]|uniref:Terminase n=1 Tax=Acinetobacter ursingii TaxID=108980 RepID=A0A3D2SKE1_9GAMM|nr:terminase [Acinetobacter ursingii]MCH2003991.1 terminase [Acinetobacter ursingii]MCU4380718.1 terminase [Acinetobacter ursingii]MCU4608260.1 terminase [Acinetobacter ursingii]HCK29045.1 terminase [Acinetobacter ursingii]